MTGLLGGAHTSCVMLVALCWFANAHTTALLLAIAAKAYEGHSVAQPVTCYGKAVEHTWQ